MTKDLKTMCERLLEKHRSRVYEQSSPCGKEQLAIMELWDGLYYADEALREYQRREKIAREALVLAEIELQAVETRGSYTPKFVRDRISEALKQLGRE